MFKAIKEKIASLFNGASKATEAMEALAPYSLTAMSFLSEKPQTPPKP